MFAKSRSDEEIIDSLSDMESVSTFTTATETTKKWGFKSTGSSDGSASLSTRKQRKEAMKKLKGGRASVIGVAGMIVVLGLVAGAAFAYLGYRSEQSDRVESFERGALNTVSKIQDSFDEYVDTASQIHGRFRHRPQFNASAYENDPETYMEEYEEWSKEFREEFTDLYEYVKASGLRFKAMQYDPNITSAERPLAEAEALSYYRENHPQVNYTGFRGFNGDSTKLLPRWRNQSFYFPIHYMEPIAGNEAAIDLDYYSSESRIRAVDSLFRFKGPSLTDRLSLVKQAGSVSRCSSGSGDFSSYEGPSYGIVLMHPGVKLSDDDETSWPREFSSIVLCMSDLMKRSTDHQRRKIAVYIHDLSHPKSIDPVFMGAVRLDKDDSEEWDEETDPYTMRLVDEIALSELECRNTCYQDTVSIANRKWTVTIIDEHDADRFRLVYTFLIGFVVFLAFLCLAIWVLATDRRNRTYSALKAHAAAERNALVLENANQAAKMERELNDFLAHEVRNPLSAAMAATTFLKTELDSRSKSNRGMYVHFEELPSENDENGENGDEEKEEDFGGDKVAVLRDSSNKSATPSRLAQAREDVRVVDDSLRFINELLRNMLDMQRASSGKLQVKMAPADLLRDVLEPVAGMLYRGGEGRIGRKGKGSEKVKIIVDCPEDVVIETDVLRLKQVILNLGRNSVKFITEGFIRLRAEVIEVDDPSKFNDEFDLELASNMTKTVRVFVEDSGSGIPEEKREMIFNKYQESLDLLSQGTGIGLHLCKNLVELMGGHINLDSEYNSGVKGYPGARFVIDLQSSPLDTAVLGLPTTMDINRDSSVHVNWSDGDSMFDETNRNSVSLKSACSDANIESLPALPKNLHVLFVDDDRVLRKLFTRTIQLVAPDWTIREAANGETAVLLAEEEEFDLIFCDMYMASVEKQLLGTETVAELRSNGVKSLICGLSANDKEMEFMEAGADAFLFKPIPCEANILRITLHRVLNGKRRESVLM